MIIYIFIIVNLFSCKQVNIKIKQKKRLVKKFSSGVDSKYYKENNRQKIKKKICIKLKDHKIVNKESKQNKNSNKYKLEIYLIRHAKTDTNYIKDFKTFLSIFKSDTDINQRGYKELKDLKNKISDKKIKIPNKFDFVCCSNLRRAIISCYYLFHDLTDQIYICPYLKEQDRVIKHSRTNNPPKNRKFTKSFSIEKQKLNLKKDKNIDIKKLNYQFVESEQRPDLFSKVSLISDINKFMDFLEEKFYTIFKNSLKQKTIKIAVVTHSYAITNFFKNSYIKPMRPKNLAIIKIDGNFETINQKNKLVYKLPEGFNVLREGDNVIFDGYSKEY